MDVTITGRGAELPERFREYAEQKIESKVQRLSSKSQSVEVRLRRRTDRAGNVLDATKVEITLIGPGPIVRAEAEAGDAFAAFDLALDKLSHRMRRAKDKRKDHQGTKLHHVSANGFADLDVVPASSHVIETATHTAVAEPDGTGEEEPEDYNPIVIRKKMFDAKRLTAEEAVDHMELLGHDFFLFVERDTERPSVVYRRRGWDYGVISLDTH